MRFIPQNDRVLMRQTNKSKGSVVLPDHISLDQYSGEVVEVGKGKLLANGERVPMDIRVGDRIVITQGSKVTVGGEEHVVVSEEHILGVYRD